MWRASVIVLLALCAAALAFDREIAKERLVQYRIRSQNLHIDHLDHEMDRLESKFDKLSTPVTEWDERMLAVRVRRQEGRKCSDREVTCGGDFPECISNLFVCDGHVDCHNGRDEDEFICDSAPVHVGSTYSGVVHWKSCVNSIDHPMIITITAVHHSPVFNPRVYVRATITADSEVFGDPERLHYYTVKGYYAFAVRQLVLLPDDIHHQNFGILCEFHFGDFNHADCHVKEVTSLRECGYFRVVKM